MSNKNQPQHYIFKGFPAEPHDNIKNLSLAPPWRNYHYENAEPRGKGYQPSPEEKEVVNAAMILRRPILITGKPGIGKSSLAYAIQFELKLADVLVWPITTRTTLLDGLYSYDAIGRLQEENRKDPDKDTDIGRFIRLGPLGTAMLGEKIDAGIDEKGKNGFKYRPRVLLIDEIDKSDIDLPNDLLNVFEEGTFRIPELVRLPKNKQNVNVYAFDSTERESEIEGGIVRTAEFPIVIMTSNDERDFPPAFRRRCLSIHLKQPDKETLHDIVKYRLHPPGELQNDVIELVDKFFELREKPGNELSTDQLLNAVHLLMQGVNPISRPELLKLIMRSLNEN